MLTASPHIWIGAWKSIIIAGAFSVMAQIVLSATAFFWSEYGGYCSDDVLQAVSTPQNVLLSYSPQLLMHGNSMI